MTLLRLHLFARLTVAFLIVRKLFAPAPLCPLRRMIVDHSLYQPGAPLADGLMHIVTQQPGLFLSEDVTHVLRAQSYWPSYNRPYFKRIFSDMGFAALQQQYGDYLYSYNNSFRALIFRREQENIHTSVAG